MQYITSIRLILVTFFKPNIAAFLIKSDFHTLISIIREMTRIQFIFGQYQLNIYLTNGGLALKCQ